MFGLGITEIITIIVVIIILVNPKDLPVIVRKVGKIYGGIMKQINGLRKTFVQFEEEVKIVTSLTDDEIVFSKKKATVKDNKPLKVKADK